MVKSSETFSEYQKIAADFSFKGWGAKVKAEFAMDSKDSYSNDEVRFVAFRKLFYGFTGYEIPPPFS